MFHSGFFTFLTSLTRRECRNEQGSPLQQFLCWLFSCCPDEAGEG